MRYYSATTRGFYEDDIHGAAMPEDVVEVSDELYDQLQAGFGAGKQIAMVDGQPAAIDPPPPDTAQCWASLRAERDQLLSGSDWIIRRHKEQKELVHATSITDQVYMDWLTYRQALRDLPAGTPDPRTPTWPQSPA